MKIIESEKAKRITSLEISALKGMRHEAVKKIINRLVTQDQIPAPAKEFGQIRDKIGRFRSVYVYAFYGDSAELLNTIFPPAVIPAETKVESCGLESAKEAADQPAASQEIVLPPIDPGAVRTMSSREIAELTGKAHFHVMRDLRALKEQLGAMFGGAIQSWIHPQNRQEYEEFVIDKDTCLTLLLGYDPVARMKVVKRWQALEAQVTRQPSTGQGQSLALSQMFAMFSEQAGKIEQQLQRQAQEIEAIKAALLLPRPTPKPRTKNPTRTSGLQDWQVAKYIKSVRFSFSISPHEIGLESFYAQLHSLNSPIEQRDALRKALQFGVPLDTSMPLNFPEDAKTITIKLTISENDKELQDVLSILLSLPNDKQRRAEVKRQIIRKSMDMQAQNFDAPANQQGLF